MTCIVGIETGKGVMIGADSAAVGGVLDRNSEPKVFIRGEFLIGYTTSFRMGQVLQYTLDVEKQRKETDHEYLCTVFVDAVKECFNKGGFSGPEDTEDEGGTFLVGYRGKLYKISDDFAVVHSTAGFCSCGYGEYVSKASLHTTRKLEIAPKKRLKLALEAAQYLYPSYVTTPFHYMTLG